MYEASHYDLKVNVEPQKDVHGSSSGSGLGRKARKSLALHTSSCLR